MGEYTGRHGHFPEEEEEEALSLCDLPLEDDNEISGMISSHSRRSSSSSSSSEPPEFFEFFSNFTASDMRSAEDIIFCGKLIPFKDHSPAVHSRRLDKRHIPFRRRSESLSGLHLHSSSVSHSNGNINDSKLMMRNSRSLDYRKLERFSNSKRSPETDRSVERNNSMRGRGRCDQMNKKTVAKPRWYLLMFGGVVRPPTEMELKDIKSRQVRRNSTTTMLPPPVADSVKKPPVGKGSCKLINVLSCKDPTSVAVTTSFNMPPG